MMVDYPHDSGRSHTKLMSCINPLLSSSSIGRIATLQSILQYLLSVAEIDDEIQLHDDEGEEWIRWCAQVKKVISRTVLLDDELEEVIEDCIVILFKIICGDKFTILVEDIGYIYNFYGYDIVSRLREWGYNSWAVLSLDEYISEDKIPFDLRLMEKMDNVSLLLCSQVQKTIHYDNNSVLKSISPHVDNRKPYVAAYPRGITLKRNKVTKLLKTPNSPSGFHASFCIAESDYFYVPNHSITENIFHQYKQSCPLPRELLEHRRKITAVPLGNLKLSRTRVLRRNTPVCQRSDILFFPEAYDYPNSLSGEETVDLIRKILEAFPNNRVIYRPHPAWVDSQLAKCICSEFFSQKRFVFDDSTLSETTLIKGCVLITEGSLSGLTYTLSTSRPSVYIKPQVSHFNNKTLGIEFKDGVLFRFCYDFDEVIERIKDLVADPEKEFYDASEILSRAYDHSEDGEDYLKDVLHAILHDKKLPDWSCLHFDDECITDDLSVGYSGLVRNDVLTFSALPAYINVDLEEFSYEIKSMIFYSCSSEHQWHSAITVNIFIWVINNILKYGYSAFKGVLLFSVLRNILKVGGSELSLSFDMLLPRILNEEYSGKNEAVNLFGPLLYGEVKDEECDNYIGNNIDEYLNQIGRSPRQYWNAIFKDLKDVYGCDKIAFYGAGSYCRKLLEEVVFDIYLPVIVYDRSPPLSFPIMVERSDRVFKSEELCLSDVIDAVVITSPANHLEIESALQSSENTKDLMIVNPFSSAPSFFELSLWY